MRFRYSIKTLLIVTTVVAVIAGYFGLRLKQAAQQQAAVKGLQAAGASVSYEEKYRWRHGPNVTGWTPRTLSERWDEWQAKCFGLDFVYCVQRVYYGLPASSDFFLHVQRLPELPELDVSVQKGFSDAAWASLLECGPVEKLTIQREPHADTRRLTGLSRLNRLRGLVIEGGELTLADAREIAQLTGLHELELHMVATSDDAIQPLANLKSLETFDLMHIGLGKNVTASGLAFVARMPMLRSLTLDRLPSLNDDVFSHLESITHLESLNLDQATITGAEVQRLARLPNLKTLNLIGTQVDDEAMKKLAELTQLESLDISFTKVTDAGLKHVGSLNKLRSLRASGNAITDAGMAELSRLTQLEELMIGNNEVSDAGLKQLAQLSNLRALWLGGNSKVTKQGVAKLKAALPNCNIDQH